MEIYHIPKDNNIPNQGCRLMKERWSLNSSLNPHKKQVLVLHIFSNNLEGEFDAAHELY